MWEKQSQFKANSKPNKANSKPIKANLLNAQINVCAVLTRDYENKSNWTLGGNKPNSKPIKANFTRNKANSKPNKANSQKAAMFVTTFLTKEYENISNWTLFENKANTNPNKANFPAPRGETNPIQTQSNPTCSELVEPISKAKKCCRIKDWNGQSAGWRLQKTFKKNLL
jgi:hypothetical protein